MHRNRFELAVDETPRYDLVALDIAQAGRTGNGRGGMENGVWMLHDPFDGIDDEIECVADMLDSELDEIYDVFRFRQPALDGGDCGRLDAGEDEPRQRGDERTLCRVLRNVFRNRLGRVERDIFRLVFEPLALVGDSARDGFDDDARGG